MSRKSSAAKADGKTDDLKLPKPAPTTPGYRRWIERRLKQMRLPFVEGDEQANGPKS